MILNDDKNGKEYTFLEAGASHVLGVERHSLSHSLTHSVGQANFSGF